MRANVQGYTSVYVRVILPVHACMLYTLSVL